MTTLDITDEEAVMILTWWFHYVQVLKPGDEEIELRNKLGRFVTTEVFQ